MNSIARANRRVVALAVATSPMLCCAAGDAPQAECPAGLFGVAAQVVRIDPYGATVEKLLIDGKSKPIGLNGLICAGESLPLVVDGPVKKVDLVVRGRKQTLIPPDKFDAERDSPAFVSQGLQYLSEMIRGARTLKPAPTVPAPTAIRGSMIGGAFSGALTSSFSSQLVAGDAAQLRAMRLLSDLPRQSIVTGIKPLLSWREGKGPYVCRSVSDTGQVLTQAQVNEGTSWCALSLSGHGDDQLSVVDKRGQQETWNVRVATWRDVPRPEWIPPDADKLSPPDQAAWGLWLWKHNDAAWRLQALGMLHDVADRVWIAGYLRDSLLAGDESFNQ